MPIRQNRVQIYTPRDIKNIKKLCQINVEILNILKENTKPNITTQELDNIAASEMLKRKVKSAFKGYQDYPAHICTSVNEYVVHSIPNSYRLKDGDILTIDIGITNGKYYSDLAITVPVGKITPEAQKLIDITELTLAIAIEYARPIYKVSDISKMIEKMAILNKHSVIKEFTGHGIGKSLHEEPYIFNYYEKEYYSVRDIQLEKGMVLCIEPILTKGSSELEISSDGWVVKTKDMSLVAHFEIMIEVTDDMPNVLSDISRMIK